MDSTTNTPASQLYIRATIMFAVILSIGFTWLVMAAGTLKPNLINSLVQLLIIAIIVSLLVLVIRRFQRTRKQLELARANAESEAALLRKRSAFIYGASSKLSDKLGQFEAGIAGLDENDKNAGPLKKKTAELRDLLHRLETISKLEANMALTSSVRVDTTQLLDDVAKQYQPTFQTMGAQLQVDAPDNSFVDGDESMLREVFVAVVDNAAKFVPAQTGLLDINARLVRRHLQITFTDNGPGIEASKLPELFQPFSRTDGVMAFNRQGQGLSLYISRLCIEIMGGSIVVNSEAGSGTTVVIDLPLAKHSTKKLK